MKLCPICKHPSMGGICKNCRKTIVSPAEAMRYMNFKKPEKKKLPN